MKPIVYIFRGAPASGKGTLTPEFCKTLTPPVALIEQDKFRWGFHLIGREVKDVQEEEHALANQITLLAYEEYLKKGMHAVVVEGLFTWDDEQSSQGSAKKLLEIAEKQGFIGRSVVLQASKEELLRRNANREYVVPDEEFEQLYENVYRTIDPSEIVIDSTGLELGDTLGKLLQQLAE